MAVFKTPSGSGDVTVTEECRIETGFAVEPMTAARSKKRTGFPPVACHRVMNTIRQQGYPTGKSQARFSACRKTAVHRLKTRRRSSADASSDSWR